MKRSFLAVSALTTVLAGGIALAQSQSSDQPNEMANVEAIMQRAHQAQQQIAQTQHSNKRQKKPAQISCKTS